MSTQTLALIVARGGSKGVPRKNLRLVAGHPLIAYTFLAARRSRMLDRTIVSTDDPEIADTARRYGVEVPFMRPPELAGDDSHVVDATLHALDWLERCDGYCPEQIMLLQPTSPFRTEEDIDRAILVALERHAPAVVSVCESSGHPCLAKRIRPDGKLTPFVESDFQTSRRQQLPEAYDLNGAIYLVRREVLLEERSWCPSGAHAYVMPPERSMDIDSPWDLHVADWVMRAGDLFSAQVPSTAHKRPAGDASIEEAGPATALAATRPPPVTIASRPVGPGHPCFIIAEAGVNHNGDPELACRLIDAAADAGADAVKFQTFKTDRLVTRNTPKAAYQRAAVGPDEDQYQMLKHLELDAETHARLERRCREKGILFLSTPFDEESADLLDALGVPAFKIGSGDLTNHVLLRHVARKGKPMILSTGMADIDEVRQALAALAQAGNHDRILLHCVSNYPADPANANLRAMHTLATEFAVPGGFSDHTPGTETAAAAVALGASVIEKHFTLDRTLEGPDHGVSLTPDELTAMIRSIRIVESALGDGVKCPVLSEKEVAAVARRSVVARRAIRAGTILSPRDLAIKRPGTGLPSSMLPSLLGRRARVAIPPGALLSLEMIA